MGDHRPKIWLSDGYSAQQKHGYHHQTCLAHLARDVAYGVENSAEYLPFHLKLWMDRVFVLAREVATYAASTIKRKKHELQRNLAELVRMPCACPIAEELRGKMARASPKLLTFLDFPGEVDVTKAFHLKLESPFTASNQRFERERRCFLAQVKGETL